MSTELMTRNDVRELTEETAHIATIAKTFKIATNASYLLAGDELKRIKGAAKRLEAVRKAITGPMDAAKAAVMDFFRAPTAQLEEAESQIKAAMVVYQSELQRREATERKVAQEIADAERERLALASARAAERGETDTAIQLATQSATVAEAPVIHRLPPKVSGVNFRDAWKFEVTDATAIPREYLLIDESKIRKVVQAMKGDTRIPGVRVFSEKSLAAGSA